MKTPLLCCLTLLVTSASLSAQELKDPSFTEVIGLNLVSSPTISPDGRHVVYQRRTTDWANNRYDQELWLAREGEPPFQLTHTPEQSSYSASWSPDGRWIAFKSDRGNGAQVHVIRAAGGEAFPLTDVKGGVGSYAWHPDGSQIAFLRSEDREKVTKKKEERYGSFAVDDAEYGLGQLWVQDFDPAFLAPQLTHDTRQDSLRREARKPHRLLEDLEAHIGSFAWSPDGRKIALQHQPDPLINSFFHADISLYDVADSSLTLLVGNPSADGLIDWSPDGRSILYTSSLADSTSNYYRNRQLFRIDLDGSNNQRLAADFDENIYGLSWNERGIYGYALQRNQIPLLRVDPASGTVRRLATGLPRNSNPSFSDDGRHLAFVASGDDDLAEVYRADHTLKNFRRLTDASTQIRGWATSRSEMISWKSEDGATIEGVLHKPRDYDPAKKYPLLVVIHGGPTGISLPNPVPGYVYPMVQWLNKGALVLEPNYRGSAGYGEKFRSLNVKNLGVGDAWDVLSGVRHLEEQGLIDGDKVGCMGWSQGGYISAFLTTNSDKFKAVSVGAGISNWMTYYVNTDIHPFTRQYLKATPWSDKAIYEKTSPMTNINQASTPTLIQHGEFDRRVPIANAYELLQGLRDVGVPTKLIVYKGFGHGITKPKERLAATWHNWQWFGKYLWGEEIEIPD